MKAKKVLQQVNSEKGVLMPVKSLKGMLEMVVGGMESLVAGKWGFQVPVGRKTQVRKEKKKRKKASTRLENRVNQELAVSPTLRIRE